MVASAAGGVPPLNVSIRITTSGAKAAANAMANVTGASQRMSRGFGTGVITARTLGDAMRMSASLMKYTVAGAFMKVGTAAIQAARNFELSFSRIRGLTGMAQDSVERMKEGVLDMAVSTTRGPEELAEALYFVTSSGIRDATVAMDVLGSSAKASAAGLGETKTVADAVTSAMNAYGPANLSAARATDILVATVREGKAEADTFAPAFSKVLPVAAAFGASFEDVAAAMAALTRSGMTAGTAGIYVRQTLSQLLKPSKQGAEALMAVGTSAEQVRKNIREKGLFAGLSELSEKLGGTDEGAQKFAKVFGNVRALTAMLQLVGPAAAENELVFERLQNSTGDLSDAFVAYEDTIDAKFNKALASSRVALIEIGNAIKPVVTGILTITEKFMGVAKFFIDNPIAKGFLMIASVATLAVLALSSVMKTGSALVRLGANLVMSLQGTQIMYDANTMSLYRLTSVQGASAGATQTMTVGNAVYTKVTLGAVAVTKAFGKALFALVKNPYFLAISALIAIGTTAYMFMKKAKKEAEEARDAVSKITDILDEAVKYGDTTFKVDVEVDTDTAEIRSSVDRIGEQIEEMSPGFNNRVSQIMDEMGEQAGIAYLQSLMDSVFAGMTEDTKSMLIKYFKKEFDIKSEDWNQILVPERVSGDKVTDAFIDTVVISAANASGKIQDKMKSLGGYSISTFISAMQDEMYGEGFDRDVTDAAGRFGSEIVANMQATEGALQPLLFAFGEFDKAGILTSETMRQSLGNALNQLNGDLNIAKEETADFFAILSHSDNKTAISRMIKATTGEGDAKAGEIFDTIQNQLSKIPNNADKSVEAFRILKSALEPYLGISAQAVVVADKQSNAFRSLQEDINNVIDGYKQQVTVIKRLEDAQRNLLGINLDQEESMIGVFDALKSLRGSLADGGGFDMLSEAGRNNREELKDSALAITEYANTVYAETGDAALAGLKFQEGIMGIIDAAGADGAAAQQLLTDLGFTPDWFAKSIIAGEDEVTDASVNTGKDVIDGVRMGIETNAAGLTATMVDALRGVVVASQKELESRSPSRKTARLLGVPMAQGIGVGFRKELKKQSGGMANDLNTAVSKMYTGKYDQKSIQKFFKNFLDKKKNVETPAQDFVKETIGRMKDIIGSLGNYIKSQLSFREAQANLAKLINTQRKYDDERKRSARELQYSETRRGAMGGAEVTGYEQAEIDQLQIEFERVSRDYAMGRATYIDLVDAEIALYEARAAASEVNDEVISAQNDFIDATAKSENKTLELSSATVDVLEAYQDVQEAAYELYINHKELEGVYNSLATATGIAAGQISIGSTNLATLGEDVNKLGGYTSTVGGYVSTLGNNVGIAGQAFTSNFYGKEGIFGTITKTGSDVKTLTNGIGANFIDMSRGLLNEDSEMYKNLKSLGPAIFNAIQTAANEQFAKSPLTLRIPVNVLVDTSGGGGIKTDQDKSPYKALSYEDWAKSGSGLSFHSAQLLNAYRSSLSGQQYQGTNVSAMVAAYQSSPSFKNALARSMQLGYEKYLATRAYGGALSADQMTLVGEKGPEMFIPKVSGTIVTNSALERYTRVRDNSGSVQQGKQSNNIVVTVNNPVPAAAEDSITRRMKVLSNSGLFG